MTGAERIPRYVLQEFHNLPNGNYSKQVTHGYSSGFDAVMLGVMEARREAMARATAGCRVVLDIGCGAGHTAGAVLERRSDEQPHEQPHEQLHEVWGLDPSPYLLKHAAREYPGVRFVQGIAEETGFAARRFDAVTACFLFHELPPRAIEAALVECHRILRRDGRLVITEPGREHWQASAWRLFLRYGWRGVYFRWLARAVYEPFLAPFHALDFRATLRDAGFELIAQSEELPTTSWLAVRR